MCCYKNEEKTIEEPRCEMMVYYKDVGMRK